MGIGESKSDVHDHLEIEKVGKWKITWLFVCCSQDTDDIVFSQR